MWKASIFMLAFETCAVNDLSCTESLESVAWLASEALRVHSCVSPAAQANHVICARHEGCNETISYVLIYMALTCSKQP